MLPWADDAVTADNGGKGVKSSPGLGQVPR